MNTALWIVQCLLAAAFLGAGIMKLRTPFDQLRPQMGWVEDVGEQGVRIIGALELLAAVGLILPMLLDILPVLTPLAAIGLVLTMSGAASLHFRRGEIPFIGMNMVFLLLAAFVVYGRLVDLPMV